MLNTVEILQQVRQFARAPFSSIGGYPKVLIMSDGATVCSTCARENYRLISHSTRHHDGDGWQAAGVQLHEEGAPLYCDQCNAATESAYGDPYAEEDEAEAPETIEYSVCIDCLHELANGDNSHDIGPHVTRELDGRAGHFSIGVSPTDEDPEGTGHDEFSWSTCELCRSRLGGSRHGITLFITGQEQ